MIKIELHSVIAFELVLDFGAWVSVRYFLLLYKDSSAKHRKLYNYLLLWENYLVVLIVLFSDCPIIEFRFCPVNSELDLKY